MGCIPTKALVRSAEAIDTARRGAEFGFRAEVEVDSPAIVARKSRIVARSRGGVERSLEGNERIELVRGWARFEGRDRASVDDRALVSERIIVASVVQPHVPDVPGLAEAGYLTNETVMDLETLPEHMIVIGGGPEGSSSARPSAGSGAR